MAPRAADPSATFANTLLDDSHTERMELLELMRQDGLIETVWHPRPRIDTVCDPVVAIFDCTALLTSPAPNDSASVKLLTVFSPEVTTAVHTDPVPSPLFPKTALADTQREPCILEDPILALQDSSTPPTLHASSVKLVEPVDGRLEHTTELTASAPPSKLAEDPSVEIRATDVTPADTPLS